MSNKTFLKHMNKPNNNNNNNNNNTMDPNLNKSPYIFKRSNSN
jgi:hypothetical protein